MWTKIYEKKHFRKETQSRRHLCSLDGRDSDYGNFETIMTTTDQTFYGVITQYSEKTSLDHKQSILRGSHIHHIFCGNECGKEFQLKELIN